MKEKNRMFYKKLLLYVAIYVILLVALIFSMQEMFDLDKLVGTIGEGQNNFHSCPEIIINNTKNFLGYLLLFPIFPIMIIMDFFSMGVSIVISIFVQGPGKTALLLLPHGLLEIPNFLLYTFLSCTLFYNFWKNKKWNIKEYWYQIIAYKRFYLISILFIVFAGVVEGVITPRVYQICNL